jgi:hypothetical protein
VYIIVLWGTQSIEQSFKTLVPLFISNEGKNKNKNKIKQNKTDTPITPKDPTPLQFIRTGVDPDPHTKPPPTAHAPGRIHDLPVWRPGFEPHGLEAARYHLWDPHLGMPKHGDEAVELHLAVGEGHCWYNGWWVRRGGMRKKNEKKRSICFG